MEYKLSKSLYERDVLLKVIYSIGDKFNIYVSENANESVLNIESKNDCDFDFSRFNQELQEQQLRENLNKQFGSLRESIYKKAFSIVER